MLTLTFDNGPDPVATPQVLRELAARGLPAIFFPVGRRLEEAGALDSLAAIAAAGHAIGNHTYSHPRPFGRLSDEEAVREIARTDALLAGYLGPERMFRPSAGGGRLQPGVLNRGAVDYLVRDARTLVLWTLVCEDWARPDGSWSDLALEGMAREEWTLLVLHDIASGAMDHLGRFLDAALEAGVEFSADLPDAAVPIRRGEVMQPVDWLLAPDEAASMARP